MCFPTILISCFLPSLHQKDGQFLFENRQKHTSFLSIKEAFYFFNFPSEITIWFHLENSSKRIWFFHFPNPNRRLVSFKKVIKGRVSDQLVAAWFSALFCGAERQANPPFGLVLWHCTLPKWRAKRYRADEPSTSPPHSSPFDGLRRGDPVSPFTNYLSPSKT